MDASSLLVKIAKTMKKVRLEAIMVGNAAAALHGAPVTTLDEKKRKIEKNNCRLLKKRVNATSSNKSADCLPCP